MCDALRKCVAHCLFINMARRKTSFLPNNYYHVYNRGVNHTPIFKTDDNYVFLLHRIKEYSEKYRISMIAYCLMPNHYHMLVRQDSEHSLSVFIQAVFNSYTKAFNKAFDRTGTLFEGPFQAIHIDNDSYLIHLCRYIHRNPLEAKLVSNPGEWLYSNYPEWLTRRSGFLVDNLFVREHFPSPREYEQFVIDYEPPQDLKKAISKLTLEN